MMRGLSGWVVVALGGLTALVGCSTAGGLSADAPIFRGVDRAIVEETLGEPVLKDRYDNDEDRKTQDQMVQARAFDYQACRAAYEAYKTWRIKGTPGTLPALTAPTEVVTDGFKAINDENEQRIRWMQDNDIEAFQASLVGEMKCGREIPVASRDYGGQKIEDAIAALSAS